MSEYRVKSPAARGCGVFRIFRVLRGCSLPAPWGQRFRAVRAVRVF
jgi:hypothetical protein